jgi:hypothetical protein
VVTTFLAAALAAVFSAYQPQHEHHQMPPMQGHEDHMQHGMKGALGPWPMSQEGGGTTWLPAASPHFAKMLENAGPYDLHVMGLANFGYIDAGGKRGDEELFSNSMAMLQAHRQTGGGELSLRLMLSLDPILAGKNGNPNLFQTGEALHGEPLVDRQHPHDLIAELAASYSKPIGGDRRGFLYLGFAGEPALGNTNFLHRPSAMENPEAPISHHWFDATHISYGVVTAGLTWGSTWKLDASAFNGREPDEDRFDIESGPLDSSSIRIAHNPSEKWSLSAAYGFLKEPEQLEPGEDQHRVTGSIAYADRIGKGRELALSLNFGRNIKDHGDTNALNFETTLYAGNDSYFLRYENVEKDEIFNVPEGTFTIGKLTLGGVRNIAKRDGYNWGLGAFFSLFSFPDELESAYGKNPVSWGVFLRIRPGRM